MKIFSFSDKPPNYIVRVLYTLGSFLGMLSYGVAMAYFYIFLPEPLEYMMISSLFYIFGNMVWRILCEGLMLAFGIHERLGEIRDLLRNSQ